MLSIALANKATVLILGALGCGAYNNPPEVVVECFKSALADYGGYFKKIVFAIIDGSHTKFNYTAFCKGLCNLKYKSPQSYTSILREPCKFGGTCRDLNDSHHSLEFHHMPLCENEKCNPDEAFHDFVFLHKGRTPRIDHAHRPPLGPQDHARLKGSPVNSPSNQPNILSDGNQKLPTPISRCPHEKDNAWCTIDFVEDLEHFTKYRHICKNGIGCKIRKPSHDKYFDHIFKTSCPEDRKCRRLNDWQHRQRQHHPGLPDYLQVCSEGQDECPKIKDHNHLLAYKHKPGS